MKNYLIYFIIEFLRGRKSRTTFYTSDTRRAYGPIVIDYSKVQAKVILKNWEEKLDRMNALFDVGIYTHRRWVYLKDIYSSSADIKTLLPVETQRFNSMRTEFLSLMKKVTNSPKGALI